MPLVPENSAGAGTSASPSVVAGDVASGATDSGNPVKIGGVASTSSPAEVTNGQRVNLAMTTHGLPGIGSFVTAGDAVTGNASGTLFTGSPLARVLTAGGYVYNSTTWDRTRAPSVFKLVSAVVITAETTVWTPAGGKKFRLMGFVITQGVLTGAITLRDNTAGTTILTIPQTTIGVVFASPPMGNGILSAAANNVLTAQGAVTETITGYFFGTEE